MVIPDRRACLPHSATAATVTSPEDHRKEPTAMAKDKSSSLNTRISIVLSVGEVTTITKIGNKSGAFNVCDSKDF